MTKYNKKEIMQNAWNLVKTTAITISNALKQAWSKAKAPKIDFNEKDVYLTKNNSLFIKETEKAVCYKLAIKCSKSYDGYYTSVENTWIPKSVLQTLENGWIKVADWFVAKNFAHGLSFDIKISMENKRNCK